MRIINYMRKFSSKTNDGYLFTYRLGCYLSESRPGRLNYVRFRLGNFFLEHPAEVLTLSFENRTRYLQKEFCI
jgi:hypothetical protein